MTGIVEAQSKKKPNRHLKALGTWLLIIGKLPKLAALLKVLKAGKALVLISSMLVSTIAYAYALGSWTFGVGLVALLFVHEMGHVWAAYRLGVKTSWPIFIPFIGAAIFIKKFNSVRHEAIVGIGGPVLGTLAVVPFALVAYFTGDKIWIGLVYIGLFLNAFNMVPLRPLDGGRVTTICGRWFKLFGFAILGALSLLIREPVMLYVWVLVLSDIAFPLWWRTVTGVALSVAMIGLMLAGYSDQPHWVDGIDSLFVFFVCLTYYWGESAVAMGMIDPFLETYDDLGSVTNRERVGWAAVWVGSFGGLGLLMMLLASWGH